MRLYVVRHGKAELGDDDRARNLSERGRTDVHRMAQRLAPLDIHVARVEHSGLVRARQTAEILAAELGVEARAIPGLEPSDNVVSMARLLESRRGNMMLVGHLPFMEKLVSYLLTGNADLHVVRLRTSSAAYLSNREGIWQLEWLFSPQLA